jgi:dipeptidyl aminopeptidase/acylaminoacyl peptidase
LTRKIAIDDFMQLKLVSDPQYAPDGARIACVMTGIDPDKNRYRSEIWITSAQGGEPRRYTSQESSASVPRWSPDGRQIAFLSDRGKPLSQIYLLQADGGEARALTKLETEGGIRGLRWSPDGRQIAFLFRATPAAYRKDAVEERTNKKLSAPVRRHTRLFYRLDGAGYHDGEYAQVWVADVETGEARALTAGDYDCGLPTWSPDGCVLAFISDRRDDSDISFNGDEIYTVPVAGGELTRVPAPAGPKGALSWSPDGMHFAYIGNPDLNDQWGTNNDRLLLIPAGGSDQAKDLTGKYDLEVGYATLSDAHEIGAGDPIQWSQNSHALLFPGSAHGDTRLYRVGIAGLSAPVPLTEPNGEMGGFSIGPHGAVAYTRGIPTAPHELFHLTASGVATQLTQFNGDYLTQVAVAAPEAVEIANGEGGTVHGWLLKPVGAPDGQKNPLILYVHGGPHTQYGNTFFHELQLLAAEGYAVLYTNPRGSKGYGEAHTKAIKGDWGGADYRDVMAGADWAVARPDIDPQRVAIMGGSYGGFMTAWAIGHTDRFRCAIADRLVGNLHSMSGTCDFPWRHGSYFAGDAWNDPAALWRCSPLAYAGRINTPLLLIHSDGDLRCPAGQAEELFAALRFQRKTVEYIRYPAEASHGLSRNGPPDLRLDRLHANLDWLGRWLKSGA